MASGIGVTAMTPESQRQLPFLKRNFARAVNALNGAFGSPSLGRREADLSPTDDGEHPRKRRRLSATQVDMEKLVASPRSHELHPQLRLEVLRCQHRDTKKHRSSSGPAVSSDVTMSATCVVSVYSMAFGRPKIRYCDSQDCQVVTFKDPAGSHRVARVALPEPFEIPRKKLLIQRVDDHGVKDLADAYKLSVELEPADGGPWPPLDLDELGLPAQSPFPASSSQYWVFSASFDDIFGRLKAPLILTAQTGPAESSRKTNYELEVDLQWTSGLMALKHLEDDSKPCVTDLDPNAPRTNGHVEEPMEETLTLVDHSVRENDEEADGEDTPSRSLRTRGGNKNYNLKDMSDRVHGRQRRSRKLSLPPSDNQGRIRYVWPPDQPVCLDGFRCVNCGIFHQSLYHLQLHLQTTHPDYDYKLETTSQGPQFLVMGLHDPPTTPSKTLSVGRPAKSFNLETFVTGDHSWLSSRLGSESKDDFLTSGETQATLGRQAAKPSRRKQSRSVSESETKVSPSKKKVLVPETQHVLYHPVSKQVLKTGQEVPEPRAERQWFDHKHCQSLNDIIDITPAELEYMKEFDSAMREQDITARAYLPRAWLNFVKKRAGWLVEAKHRMREFAMHESYLLASGLIRGEHIRQASEYIEEERTKRSKRQSTGTAGPGEDGRRVGDSRESPVAPPKDPPIRESKSGCAVCGLPVLAGPQLLICSNEVCSL